MIFFPYRALKLLGANRVFQFRDSEDSAVHIEVGIYFICSINKFQPDFSLICRKKDLNNPCKLNFFIMLT